MARLSKAFRNRSAVVRLSVAAIIVQSRREAAAQHEVMRAAAPGARGLLLRLVTEF